MAALTEETFHGGMKELHKRHDRTDTRIDTLDGHVRKVDEKANQSKIELAEMRGGVKLGASLACGVMDCPNRTTFSGPVPRRFNGRARDATMVGVGGGGLLMAWQVVQAILRAIEGSPLP